MLALPVRFSRTTPGQPRDAVSQYLPPVLQLSRSFGDVTALAVLGLDREAGRVLIGAPPAVRGGFRREDAAGGRRGDATRGHSGNSILAAVPREAVEVPGAAASAPAVIFT